MATKEGLALRGGWLPEVRGDHPAGEVFHEQSICRAPARAGVPAASPQITVEKIDSCQVAAQPGEADDKSSLSLTTISYCSSAELLTR
jgi:hypothetical protein